MDHKGHLLLSGVLLDDLCQPFNQLWEPDTVGGCNVMLSAEVWEGDYQAPVILREFRYLVLPALSRIGIPVNEEQVVFWSVLGFNDLQLNLFRFRRFWGAFSKQSLLDQLERQSNHKGRNSKGSDDPPGDEVELDGFDQIRHSSKDTRL